MFGDERRNPLVASGNADFMMPRIRPEIYQTADLEIFFTNGMAPATFKTISEFASRPSALARLRPNQHLSE